jgi:hypothetical protein
MENENEGSSVRRIPEEIFRVCAGCKFHHVEGWVYGHDFVTKNYSCRHPSFGKEMTIAFNSKREPHTPSWCPLLPVNQQNKIK